MAPKATGPVPDTLEEKTKGNKLRKTEGKNRPLKPDIHQARQLLDLLDSLLGFFANGR